MTVMIVIPSYEPRQNVVPFIKQLGEQTNREILVIDDGSGSAYCQTFQQLSELPFVTLLSYPHNRGKGFALKTGFQKIVEGYPHVTTVLTVDSDGQHSIGDIQRMIDCAEGSCERVFVLGTRTFSRESTPLKSYWGNRISSVLFYLAAGVHCADTQTGLRGLDARLLPELLKIPGERFDFEMNMLLRSKSMGGRLTQLPIATIYEENNVHSHFRPIRDSVLIYKPLLRYLASAVVSSGLDLFAFAVFFLFLGGSEAMILPATILARLLSGVVNYMLTRSWVFRDDRSVSSTAWKYGLLFLGQMLLSSLGVRLLMNLIPMALFSKILVDGLLFVVGFMIQNRLIFQQRRVV